MRIWRLMAMSAVIVACEDDPDPQETRFTTDRPTITQIGTVGFPAGRDADEIVVDGIACEIERETVGFCNDGKATFALDASETCKDVYYRATAWMEPNAPDYAGIFTLNEDATAPAPGEGAVWIDHGPPTLTDTWVSTRGSAEIETFTEEGVDYVTLSFEISTVDFLTRTKSGPPASGTITCAISGI